MFRSRSRSHHDEQDKGLSHDNKLDELKSAMGPLYGRKLIYCDDACLRRYLEARNWNVTKAKKMLEESLKWRSSYKPEEIRWPEVSLEGETGKIYRASFRDRQGRSVLIMSPGKQNTKSQSNQVRHLVYLLENAVLNLPDGAEQMSWLIDFTGWSVTTGASVKCARDVSDILQNHYPERLAKAFLYNPPRIFEAFWKVVKYFLDPKTFQKVAFVYPKDSSSVELFKSYFDDETLPTEFGGKALETYDHEEFSRMMAQDDVKTASFWGLDDPIKLPSNGFRGMEVAPEPIIS